MTKHRTPAGAALARLDVKKDEWFAKLTTRGEEEIHEILEHEDKFNYYKNAYLVLVRNPMGDRVHTHRFY